MASKAAIVKLPSPLRDLVTGAAQEGSPDYGKSEKEKVEVADWIEKVAQGDVAKPERLKDLDTQLTPRTYLVSNYLTVADVALYGALHPVLSQLQSSQYYSHPALTRYFDHIQTRPSVRKAAEALTPAFSVVEFDLEHAPSVERKADTPKKKEKAATLQAEASSAPIKKSKGEDKVAETAATEGKAQKKEKKEKEKKTGEPADKKKAGSANNGGKAPAEDAGEPVPSMIDLRVGHIVDVKKHPDADGLYVEQIDFGEETGPRTVVSGLVHYIPIEQMQDKYLVGVCNLKPASMRGIKSFAMVLAATHKDGKDAGIELVQPPPNSKPGDRVYFEGAEFENATPLSQLNPKKKIFETIQPGFTTLETKEAAWPIQYPPNVTLTPSSNEISVQGPLGSTSVALMPFMKLNFSEPSTLTVDVENAKEKKQRSMWGLTRTLIQNAIVGMTEGFTTPLYLVGVGYRAALEPDPRGAGEGRSGQRLNMKLGFSHSVFVCTDKHQLGLFAAQVRKWRPPEPYKGKGIFVGMERVRIKAVKKK
ncbi:tRNA-aminoacylation cofactor arc1 [Grifola frondosa]|uniref:tRNA-aminoacylation cofactor arc1 n=1 Tax=Grifola frondosa TaxID=5627 RepID=A0A1C7M4J2_GRIFR|nr:tRNA-aminoacylation cofactor arc1 [Grifola frondosa]